MSPILQIQIKNNNVVGGTLLAEVFADERCRQAILDFLATTRGSL